MKGMINIGNYLEISTSLTCILKESTKEEL